MPLDATGGKSFAKEEQGRGLGRRLERMWRESGQAGGRLMEPKGGERVWAGDGECWVKEVGSWLRCLPWEKRREVPISEGEEMRGNSLGQKKEEGCKITKVKAVTKGQTLFLPSFLLPPSLPYYYYCLITCVNTHSWVQYLWRTEEGARSPGAGATGDVDAGNWTLVLWQSSVFS